MNIIAQPHSRHVVFQFVDNMNRVIYMPPFSHPEKGKKLAQKRRKAEAERMKEWHKSAAAANKDKPASRQVRRRMERVGRKSYASATNQARKRR